MLFNSYVFIFAFLPIALAGYFLCNKFNKNQTSKIWLVLCSLFFYGYFNPSYLWIIVSSICINFALSLYFEKHKESSLLKKALYISGLILNLGLLFVYKYLGFVVETTANIFNTDIVFTKLVLPLGISFFTFQQVSYLVDSYLGKAKKYNFLDYSLFVTFFPQLIAGPIVLHSEVIPQFENKNNWKFNFDNFAKGLFAFSRGLAKKVLIADNFGKIVAFGYANLFTLSGLEAWLSVIAYTIQIYFDFSGYCDMATGIGYMFNIELPINFNSPYKALNISDFWKRWHMTLTRFLTQYIYIPLGGSRKGIAITYINTLIVFVVSGIWHGAGFTFILWGMMHGIAMVLYKAFAKYIDKIPAAIRWVCTFAFINITWVYFRALSVSDANQMVSKLFAGGMTLNFEITETLLNIIPISILSNLFEFSGNLTIIILSIVVLMIAVCLFTKNVFERTKIFEPKASNLLTSAFLLMCQWHRSSYRIPLVFCRVYSIIHLHPEI